MNNKGMQFGAVLAAIWGRSRQKSIQWGQGVDNSLPFKTLKGWNPHF